MSLTQERAAAGRTVSHPGAAPARVRDRWIDQFLGSDPGFNRLRGALQCVLAVALAIEAEWLFVHFTGALLLPIHAGQTAAQSATVAMANHEYLVIAILLGAIVGMISSFGVMDVSARGQAISTLFCPVPLVAALALGIALGPHRILALVVLALDMALATYLRRFGPRGMLAGMLLFVGYFFGFFLHSAVTTGDLGWLSAEIGVGVSVAMAVRFGLFYPRPAKALARTQRSYGARARKVASLALELFDDPEHSERDARRLHNELVRLNEAALMIDAQLGNASAVDDGSSAQLLHQRLFDVELALTNVARFAQAMSRMQLPPEQRVEAHLALLALTHRDSTGARSHAKTLLAQLAAARSDRADEDPVIVVVPHRFASSVMSLADAGTQWRALGDSVEAKDTFAPSVSLFGGWLPGSAQVSATASLEPGLHEGHRLGLAPYTRAAIQMGVAVGAAIALGVLISSDRFYWAVIAAFITFMGTNNSGEQAAKALYRVLGTVVGIGIGSLLVDVVGHHAFGSIAVILVALFLGLYLMRINYAFFVVAITVMVSQLYIQLSEFSNSLLLVRLEETALGAAVTVVVVMVVFPLRTRRVLRVALREYVQSVDRMVQLAQDRLLGREHHINQSMRSEARALDASYQTIVATAQPLRRNIFGSFDERTGEALRLATASRNYARNLVMDVEAAGALDSGFDPDIEQACATLRRSLGVVARTLNGRRNETYIRSSALFDRTDRALEQPAVPTDGGLHVIRDLKLIDGAMAFMATLMGLAVTDYDTCAR